MNKFFKMFQHVTESTRATLTIKSASLEFKRFATRFKRSLQPRFQKQKMSASSLQESIPVCNNVEHTEDIWHSQQKIAAVPKLDIYQQLGAISGCSFKIQLLGSQCKTEAFKKAQAAWNRRLELLKKIWFIDAKAGTVKDVSAWDKDNLIQDVCINVDLQVRDLNVILWESLKPIYQELEAINLKQIKAHISLLDRRSQAQLADEIDLLVREIEAKFCHISANFPISTEEFSDRILPVETFTKPGVRVPISLEQLAEFSKERVFTTMENLISSVVDDSVKLATGALQQAIAFYNDFLERQEQHREETPQRPQTQKAWVEKQSKELTRENTAVGYR